MSATTAAAAAAGGAPVSAKPWLAILPAGGAGEIDEAARITLAAIVPRQRVPLRERPAVESFGKRITYAELGTPADAVASWLQAKGLGKGDRVAIMLPNVLAYPAILSARSPPAARSSTSTRSTRRASCTIR